MKIVGHFDICFVTLSAVLRKLEFSRSRNVTGTFHDADHAMACCSCHGSLPWHVEHDMLYRNVPVTCRPYISFQSILLEDSIETCIFFSIFHTQSSLQFSHTLVCPAVQLNSLYTRRKVSAQII